jgi:UTP--glucose-1-phosphate uridylyltransferase
MHVLTPTVIDILGQKLAANNGPVTLSHALAGLPQQEQYLALEQGNWRYDIGVKYGLLMAQLALALNGQDREEVLSQMVELLALRESGK